MNAQKISLADLPVDAGIPELAIFFNPHDSLFSTMNDSLVWIFNAHSSNISSNEELSVVQIPDPDLQQTTWVYIIFALLLMTGLYAFIRYRDGRIQPQNQLNRVRRQTHAFRNPDDLKLKIFIRQYQEFREILKDAQTELETLIDEMNDTKYQIKLESTIQHIDKLLSFNQQLPDHSTHHRFIADHDADTSMNSRRVDLNPIQPFMHSGEQKFIEKVITIINKQISNGDFRVKDLAERMNISTSQLNRKLNVLIEQSSITLIRTIRLRRSAVLLQQTEKSISEIAYEVGFNDSAYFTRVFKKHFGKTPTQFREKKIA